MRKCNQILHGFRGLKARCTQEFGVTHDHSCISVSLAIRKGLAKRIVKKYDGPPFRSIMDNSFNRYRYRS